MSLSTLLFNTRKHPLTTAQIMLLVVIACIPGIFAMSWFFGAGVLLNIVWLIVCAIVLEACVLKIRNKPVMPSLRDFSAVVTALLLALSMPPAAPWWLGLAGIFFAIVIAKQLYGGLGYNPFNPAMVGYAVLIIAYPLEMTHWLLPQNSSSTLPSALDLLQQFIGMAPETMDAFVGATALDQFKLDRAGLTVAEYWTNNPLFGTLSGTGWEWANGGFLLGGLYMVYRKIISWHIPLTVLGTITLMALLFYDGGSSASHGSPVFHLFGGAAMLGAFFIATDPVSAPATNQGKLFYGALIGLLIYSIRVWGAYPDGVAFAVLLANFAAPTIDYFIHLRETGKAHGE